MLLCLFEDSGVDLQVQMAMRFTGPGGVVPDRSGLDLLDRDLDLPPPRPDPGGRVLGDPVDDLERGGVLGLVQHVGDLGVQGGGQGPGLGSVDRDLDESQRATVVADPALGPTGLEVDPGDPLLVLIAVHHPGHHDPVDASHQPGGDPVAFTEVVVVGAGVVALDVGAGGLRGAVVELHPAVHRHHPEPRCSCGSQVRSPRLRSSVACVPTGRWG
jgi:hypothetical protein